MFQQKVSMIFCLILTITSIHSVLACQDYGNELCTIVGSTRAGTIGHGRSCSGGAERLIVNINGKAVYDHCKYGTANVQEDTPQPPPPKAMTAAADSVQDSQLVARILAALRLEDKASAQSCDFGGQRLCLNIKAWGQEQWYCSDQSDVNSLQVERNGRIEYNCK